VLTREPGGCPIADKIRSILLDAGNQGMVPLSELLLYAAARAQHVAEVILPALASDAIVLCDRFTDATVAYQHCGRGIDRSTIDALNTLACQSVRPDLTVLMDCDVAIGLARAKSRIEMTSGPREERFELEALAFHQRVRDGYLQLAADEADRFLTLSASGSIEEISDRIALQVQERLNALC
jgi:dTMP kinase